jgi:hypothetical protein
MSTATNTAGIVDSGGKFIAGVSDTGGHIFARFTLNLVAPAVDLPPV